MTGPSNGPLYKVRFRQYVLVVYMNLRVKYTVCFSSHFNRDCICNYSSAQSQTSIGTKRLNCAKYNKHSYVGRKSTDHRAYNANDTTKYIHSFSTICITKGGPKEGLLHFVLESSFRHTNKKTYRYTHKNNECRYSTIDSRSGCIQISSDCQ